MKKHIPDLVTSVSLACGLAAVPYGVQSNWGLSVGLIFLAVIMDGMDGKAARYLKISNPHGELIDSLADICSFGFAPAILYHLAFDLPIIWGIIWLMAITFRLIRFHYVKKLERVDISGRRFAFEVGLASPWSALLLLTPVVLSYGLGYMPDLIEKASPLWLLMVASLAISPIPVSIPFVFRSKRATYGLWAVSTLSILAAALLENLWMAYMVSIAWMIIIIPMSGISYWYLGKNRSVYD